MAVDSKSDSSALPIELTRRIDAICDRWEATLGKDEELSLASYLGDIDQRGRAALLKQLVCLAIEHFQRTGVPEGRERLLSHNPEIAAVIESIIRDIAASERGKLTVTTDALLATTPHRPRRKPSRGFHISCPHCRNHLELVVDAPLDSVNCSTCGSTFSLVDDSAQTIAADTIQRIDRFELVQRLGIGGFGTVWKARDLELDRTVAVKIPRRGQLSEAEVDQFFREARSAAQLRHPNIVPVHEVGREGDTVFIVSDLIRGVSLADMLTGCRLTPRRTAELCETIALSLDHAHRRGVIHRDLKPANIIIDENGSPHLMDFGLAKREAEEVTMTVDGQIIGTPAYMSPEQAQGQSAWVDRRSDLYSLGIIIFELLTGELPFRGNAKMQVQSRIGVDAPNARTLNRHIPLDLATICARCLERAPGRRYQTAEEVAQELRRYLDRTPIKARPISKITRLARWAVRRPWPAAVAALVTLLAVAGPLIALAFMQKNFELRRDASRINNLVIETEKTSRESLARAKELEKELRAAEGRGVRSEYWPPRQDNPPRQMLLASLRTARKQTLSQQPVGESDAAAARRLLTVATIDEALGDKAAAAHSLGQAAARLEALAKGQPHARHISFALADCLDRLSQALEKQDSAASLAYLRRSIELRKGLSESEPFNALAKGLELEARLHQQLVDRSDRQQEAYGEIAKLGQSLDSLWPTDAAELYQIASWLSGRRPYLAE